MTVHRGIPRVAIFGLGRAGSTVARICFGRDDMELGAAVVVTDEKDGIDVGTLVGLEPAGFVATRDVARVADDPTIEALIYCGLGNPSHVAAALGEFVDRGKNCVAVTGLIHPKTALGDEGAAALDARARRGGGRIVGAGWNPGLLLDFLPALWGSAIPNLQYVTAERISELSTWGAGVLDDLGIGRDEVTPAGQAHLPLNESLGLLNEALSLGVDHVVVSFEPIRAHATRTVARRHVRAGSIGGFRTTATGSRLGVSVAELRWTGIFGMDTDAEGLVDSARLRIEGAGTVEASASGTMFDDPFPATAARALNVIAPLRQLPPGLYRPDQVPVSPHANHC